MNTMMQETLLSGTAHKAELPGWMAAGKTGTSQDFRDAWFIGYTANLVTGVWLGNDDNSPTKEGDRRRIAGGGLDPLHEGARIRASGPKRRAASTAGWWIGCSEARDPVHLRNDITERGRDLPGEVARPRVGVIRRDSPRSRAG
jgi:membrane peptidoglycan carboxypeptidase